MTRASRYNLPMPSERVQKRIDELLDAADTASRTNDWESVRVNCESVLDLDPDNEVARDYLDASRRWRRRVLGRRPQIDLPNGESRRSSRRVPVWRREAVSPAQAYRYAARPRTQAPVAPLVALFAAGLVVIGSLGPWARVLFITVNGTDTGGLLTLGLGVAAVAISGLAAAGRSHAWLSALGCLALFGISAIVGFYDWWEFNKFSNDPSYDWFAVRWGVVLTSFSSSVGVMASIAMFRSPAA